ncbi:MAG: 6-pyruvoyl trahydropterin synthase family protein [Pseudobdellovibrionaceae bacterium]|jgi:6-pyruvoyltetrahydropterin/6-carboxytetrahydropterin synthase
MWLLKQHFQIESARFLPHLPATHPCSRMHGHSFKIIVSVLGQLDGKIGWVIDYNDIQGAMKPILDQIDHQELNKVPGLQNPTSEIIAQWVYTQMKVVLPQVHQICVMETPTTECHYPYKP